MDKPLKVYMNLSKRIKKVRLEKNWTQIELAQKLGISQKQISAYERGAYNPSTEVLLKLAEAFNVSLDYLVFDRNGHGEKTDFKDRDLLRYFEMIDEMDESDRKTVKEILDLIATKRKLKELATG